MGNILEEIKYKANDELKKYTTFRIGGKAKIVFEPSNVEQLEQVLKYCVDNSIKYMIIGNGSNMLFSDEGYDGAIIRTVGLDEIKVSENKIYAGAGAMLSKTACVARDNELTGMEFAAGIPGTIGGAIVMNAGAYGGEMKDIVEYVDVLVGEECKRLSCEEMEFAYRKSIVDDNMIVLGTMLRLEKGVYDAISGRMEELKKARVEKQPLEYPSAGSTFKRPEGYFAAKLIDDSGLRGYRVGGAMVSDKHCGFVVNVDNASFEDVKKVMDDVSRIVMEKFGVVLEPEVRIVE